MPKKAILMGACLSSCNSSLKANFEWRISMMKSDLGGFACCGLN